MTQIEQYDIIYATNPEWLARLSQPPVGEVWIMSRDGVMCASCKPGTLEGINGFDPVPEGLEELQKKHCQPIPFKEYID